MQGRYSESGRCHTSSVFLLFIPHPLLARQNIIWYNIQEQTVGIAHNKPGMR